jgi:hypothetical protein
MAIVQHLAVNEGNEDLRSVKNPIRLPAQLRAGLTCQMSRAPRRHDRTDRQARRLQADVSHRVDLLNLKGEPLPDHHQQLGEDRWDEA